MKYILGISFIFLFFLIRCDVYGITLIKADIINNVIVLTPNTAPANQPFSIHLNVIGGEPVELENTDTSVEIYPNMSKVFRVGLPTGQYVFFNDFNPKTKPATLYIGIKGKIVPTLSSNPQSTNSNKQHGLKYTEIAFIIWRESIEAILIVGIMYSLIKQMDKKYHKSGLISLWMGAGIGFMFSVLLGGLIFRVGHALTTVAQMYFQAITTFLAVGMIVGMIKWMNKNGHKIKSNAKEKLYKNNKREALYKFSIFFITMLSVLREGSEAAVFIYAISAKSSTNIFLLIPIIIGLLSAIITTYIMCIARNIFSYKTFFKITEIMLLIFGGGLLLHGLDSLIPLGFISITHNPTLWDTSSIIKNNSFVEPLLASFIGYRARPSMLDGIVYLGYWIFVYLFLFKKGTKNENKN